MNNHNQALEIIANDLLEQAGEEPHYSNRDFMNTIIIFQTALMDKMWGNQNFDGMDVKDDHYTVIPAISTGSQTFDEPFYDLYVHYLKWRIKYKKANGKIERDTDPDWKDWMTGLGNLIGQEFPGQRLNFVPDIEGLLSATE